MATLVFAHPGWLAAALVLGCTCAAAARVARTGRRGPGLLMRCAGAVLGSGAIGGLLLAVGGAAAHTLLGLLALCGGLWLIVERYQRESAALSRFTRLLLTGARLGAWLALLVLLARPAVERVLVGWDKPLLAVLLDHSESMAIRDPPEMEAATTESGSERAVRANAAIGAAKTAIARLGELYDVRLRSVGTQTTHAVDWRIEAEAPLTNLVGALHEARELRSANGEPPPYVLLISDGAENVSDRAKVWQAAGDLAGQKTGLIALGVGPGAEQAVLVELDPLILPPRVGLRDVLHVAASGRVRGCRGRVIELELRWDDDVVESAERPIRRDNERLKTGFDLVLPGPGVHRVTVAARLPEALGGQVFSASQLVEVVADRIRVLCLTQGPRAESAFVARALRGDLEIDFTQRFRYDDAPLREQGGETVDPWAGYDVIILGRLREPLSPNALAALAEAVTQRGAGLFLSGGAAPMVGRPGLETPVAMLSPLIFVRNAAEHVRRAQLVPTQAGLRHPTLMGAATSDTDPTTGSAAERAAWSRLPPIGVVAETRSKPGALVLAKDDRGGPLLAAQEVGQGRCVAAVWEGTWHWALASDEGHALHRRMWRQMVAWLANRRPRAWVVTDQPGYALAALAGGQTRVHVRAGISGPRTALLADTTARLEPTLALRRIESTSAVSQPASSPLHEKVVMRLEQEGAAWKATLPDSRDQATTLEAGRYVLEFKVKPADQEQGSGDQGAATPETPTQYTARTTFVVAAENLERRLPTADPTLLQAAAERTREHGGRYAEIEKLPEVLEELARHDRRRRVETRERYDVAGRNRWLLLVALSFCLGAEWAGRKRLGLP